MDSSVPPALPKSPAFISSSNESRSAAYSPYVDDSLIAHPMRRHGVVWTVAQSPATVDAAFAIDLRYKVVASASISPSSV